MFVVMIAVLLWHQSRLERRLVETTVIEEAERFTEALSAFRSLYASEVVESVRNQDITVTFDYDEEIHEGKAIPLPATLSMKIGNEMSKKKLGGQTALYSGYPFPHREDEWNNRDEFGKEAWENLNKNSDGPFFRFEHRDGQRWLRYATADVMQSACVNCHNQHPETPKNDWKVGDVRGVLEVSLPLESAEAMATANMQESLIFTIGVSGLVLAGLVIVFDRLRRTSVELEQRVDERTTELSQANDHLAQHASELARSNKELDEFAYIASHDLKAPLRGIENLANFILEDAGEHMPDESRADMDVMKGRITRMNGLLDDLLAFSRVGRTEGKATDVDTGEIVEDIVGMLEIPEDFTIEAVSEMPTVHTPHAAIHTVFRNLIGNALKHRERDDGRVEISAKDQGDSIEFAVSDDGPGIPTDLHEQAFALFKTLKRRDEVEGSGMGLTLVKKMIETYGGRIELDSDEGQGATFRFTWKKVAKLPTMESEDE